MNFMNYGETELFVGGPISIPQSSHLFKQAQYYNF